MLQKMNELATGAKIGIMLVLALAIAGGGYYLMVMPLAAKNKADADQLAKTKAENQTLQQFVPKLGDLDRQIGSLKSQMELQKKIVPDEKEADKFILLLHETASSAGVSLRKLTAGSVSKKEYYTEVPYAIELDGPYYGVLSFFDKLAAQTRIVNVEAMSMKSLAKSSNQFTYGPAESVAVTATAKTFFSNEANANSAATPAAPAKK